MLIVAFNTVFICWFLFVYIKYYRGEIDARTRFNKYNKTYSPALPVTKFSGIIIDTIYNVCYPDDTLVPMSPSQVDEIRWIKFNKTYSIYFMIQFAINLSLLIILQ